MSKRLNVNCIYFISLIRALLHGGDMPEAPEGIDHATLAAIAEKQGLSCMLYHALYKLGFAGVDDAVKQKLKKTHMAYVRHSVMQEMEFYKISSALDAAGIDYMPLKGWFTRELYPEAVLRYMGDVDILIRREDSKKAYDEMIKLGYSCDKFMRYDDDKYRKSGLAFEMHRKLDTEGLADSSHYEEPFELADNMGGHCYSMRSAEAYLYTVVHGMKHFMFGGTGLRTLLDIYLYLSKGDIESERGYIDRCAEEMGVARFMHRMEDLATAVFDGSGAFDAELIDDDSADLLDFMLRSGASGSTANLDMTMLERSGFGGKGGSKKSYFLRILFPTYKSMCKRNPILKKAPVLLPVMHVWRWIQLLFCDRQQIKESLDRYNAIDDEALEKLRHIHDIAGLE